MVALGDIQGGLGLSTDVHEACVVYEVGCINVDEIRCSNGNIDDHTISRVWVALRTVHNACFQYSRWIGLYSP